MAERSARLRRHLPRLAPIAAAAATLLVAPACRADWSFVPSVSIRETYTDNVNLAPDELAQAQLVSELTPAFSLAYNTRRLKATASGSWQRFFTHRDVDTQRTRNDGQRQYAGALQGTVIDDLLFVDATANARQQNISAFGPQVVNNPYSDLNRTEVRTWSVSPYLRHNFGRHASAMLRYRHDAVDSGAHARFGNSTSDTVMLNLNSMGDERKIGWSLDLQHQDLDNDLTGESSFDNLNGRLRYRLSRSFALTGSAGYDSYDFNSIAGKTAGHNWSTGFAWNPSQRTSVQASIGRHFYGTTGSLSVNLRSRRTVWYINYDDVITTTREQFALPATIDTSALLDRLFSATIPDPVQRQQAVAAYILSAGLPPSLSESVNYLSNRFMRQKRLQASSAFRFARGNALVNVYANERTALSNQESDSPLLGNGLSTINDNVRQRGANAMYTYALGPRSNLFARATYTHTESLSSSFKDSQRLLSIGANRAFGRHVLGTLDLYRRSGGVTALGQGQYTENAIAATLSMRL